MRRESIERERYKEQLLEIRDLLRKNHEDDEMSKMTKEITARLVKKESPTKPEKKRLGTLTAHLVSLMDSYYDSDSISDSRISMESLAKLDAKKFEGLVSKHHLKLITKIIARAKTSAQMLEAVRKDAREWSKLTAMFYLIVGGDKEEYQNLLDWQ